MVRHPPAAPLEVERELERDLLIGARADPARNRRSDSLEIEPGAWPAPSRHRLARPFSVVERDAVAGGGEDAGVAIVQIGFGEIEQVLDPALQPALAAAMG